MAKRSSRIPTGRLERLARMGVVAGGFALGGIAEGAKRLVGLGEGTGNVFLAAANAKALAKRLSKMRGAAMKLGQLLSIQSDDLVPPEFAEALSLLRASADVMPAGQLRRVLGREWGKGWRDRFERFDEEPVASASIGQVHLARTRDGRDLALKIQYPGVAKSIDSDIDALAALLSVTRVLPVGIDAKGILAEAKRQLRQEADYLREAEHLKRYRKLVARAEPRCDVPGVHDDFTTARILAMDRMEGIPLEALAKDEGASAELRDEVGETILRLALEELFEFRFVQTDPNFANYLVDPGRRRVALLDLGGARDYEPALIEKFRNILAAGMAADRERVHAAALELGFLARDDRPEIVEAIVDFVLLIAEPLHAKGRYDFGASDLASRTNQARFDLVLRKRYVRAPPPETLFLLRKFVGTFFLCTKVRARIDVAKLVRPFLQ